MGKKRKGASIATAQERDIATARFGSELASETVSILRANRKRIEMTDLSGRRESPLWPLRRKHQPSETIAADITPTIARCELVRAASGYVVKGLRAADGQEAVAKREARRSSKIIHGVRLARKSARPSVQKCAAQSQVLKSATTVREGRWTIDELACRAAARKDKRGR